VKFQIAKQQLGQRVDTSGVGRFISQVALAETAKVITSGVGRLVSLASQTLKVDAYVCMRPSGILMQQ
jgi:hypothetical protein